MSDDYRQQHEVLVDLETRHDDLLRRLDALDQKIQEVLSEYLRPRAADEDATDDSRRAA